MSLDLSRRRALQLLSANIALLTAGCGKPAEEVLPYVHMPERVLPGVPLQFATTLPLGGYGRGVLCSSYDGRPIKVSGNPLHPASLGSTDVFAEAHVLSLYDPDRSPVTRRNGEITAFTNLQSVLLDRMAAWRAGADLRLLTGPITSPTVLRQIGELKTIYPGFRWHVHDPLANTAAREGAVQAFGRAVLVLPRWSEIDVIITLDADPLGPGPAQINNGRGLTERRRVRADHRAMSRLYAIESVPTLTGVKADHRWAVPPDQISAFAFGLARALGAASLADPQLSAAHTAIVNAIAVELKAASGRAVVLPGPSQPATVHALCHWINATLGAPVNHIASVAGESDGDLAALVPLLAGGAVDTLVISGCNPVYDAPANGGIAEAIGRAKLALHHGLYVDETAERCGWHIPDSHPLESWGDLRCVDGTASPVQPLIRPLYDTRTQVNLLECLAGRFDSIDYDTVRATWRRVAAGDTDGVWRRALHDGVFPVTAATPLDLPPPSLPADVPLKVSSGLSLQLQPDPTVYDGSFSNNAWLQECPKPLTKEVWSHSLGFAPADAARLGVRTGDHVRLAVGDSHVEIPARIDAAQAIGVLSLSLGYGRTRAGMIGSNIGANGFALRQAGSPWLVEGVTVAKIADGARLLATQEQFRIDGDRDDIFPVHDVATLKPAPGAEPRPSFYPAHDYAQADARWAMVIDASACIGCNACVLACQVENNVPVVGPSEIARNRDMHWLRVDAYGLETADGRTGFQPVPCMHCETAPCEPVCPVGASIHDSEGLNVQVYNRCIGTRFCEANCPYKVRRFNFFGYADGQEYGNLGAEIMHAQNNPNVSVRARGVMEKCTFCVQRISGARREAEKEGRPLREGDVTTACQNACPTQAISFGDLSDRNSTVARLRDEPQHFTLLGSLNTKPRTTYLADVRNPNPNLAEVKG